MGWQMGKGAEGIVGMNFQDPEFLCSSSPASQSSGSIVWCFERQGSHNHTAIYNYNRNASRQLMMMMVGRTK